MSVLTALWGKSSWFGGPNDPSTKSTHDQTATGVSDSVPGIAVYNQQTKGGFWLIKAPNGNIGIVKQTDIGPAPFTGRKFDYTYSLLPLFGYTQKDFPTGGQTFGYYLGKDIGAPSFGQNFGQALGKLGATPTQSATLIQSLDSGAIMQGHTAVVAAPNGTPGQTNTGMGQTPSTSSAVPGGINLPDIPGALSSIFNQIVTDLKYGSVLLVVLVLGAVLVARGLSTSRKAAA